MNEIMSRSNTQRYAVYHSQAVQAWEKRWFAQNNASYGLMQQAAWAIALQIEQVLDQQAIAQSFVERCSKEGAFHLDGLREADLRNNPFRESSFREISLRESGLKKSSHKNSQYSSRQKIVVWCGQGNNAGDGYLIAKYLKQRHYQVEIYAPQQPLSADAQRAEAEASAEQIKIHKQYGCLQADIHIDALFGIGLNRTLDAFSQHVIAQFNAQSGYKIAVDLPSGLHPDTGMPLPVAIKADLTLCVIALKLGLCIGQAQNYVGQLIELPLIPIDETLQATAYIDYTRPVLPSRQATQHKGDFGHVLVIGGHPTMGGAVIMSGEAAMVSGAGKVTILCDAKHHTAIVSRSPNIMLKDMGQTDVTELSRFLQQIDVVCFGMGLGRDAWAETNFNMVIHALKQQDHLKTVILDADALWFLASHHESIQLFDHWIATPHSGEAARLLNCTVADIEEDRVRSIHQLQQQYGGQWVLKGAGSLTLTQHELNICAFGNAGMGTAGMGDVLAGMMAALKAQFEDEISITDVVALHALAGDELAKQGMRGIQAQHMVDAIYKVVNY